MRRFIALALVVSLFVISGCSYSGINSMQLPGTKGYGDDSYRLRIEMDNVGNLVPNNPVRFRDVEVGTITDISLNDWNAVVTVAIEGDVVLPKNTRASIGQGSLLGAKFIELSPPAAASSGRLAGGDVIPLSRTGRYPETEDVLASVAVLLNGGGLQHIKTISGELHRAMKGRTSDMRKLLQQVNKFVSGLEKQKGDIVQAIDGLDRMGAQFDKQDAKLRRALRDVPPALTVLEKERKDIVKTLDSLGNFGSEADRVLGATRDELAENLRNLEPALKGLADAGPSLVDSLYIAGTVAFPLRTFDKYVRGDFINFSITVDLTLGTLDRNFLTDTPFAGALGQIETILARGGTVTDAINPLLPEPLASENRLPGIPSLPGLSPKDGKPAPNPDPDAFDDPDPEPSETPKSSGVADKLFDVLGGVGK